MVNRRQVVSELMGQGVESWAAIRTALTNRGIINEKTGKPYSRRTIVRDMEGMASNPKSPAALTRISSVNGGESSRVKETIGKVRRSYFIRYHDHLMKETADQTRADYEFYDELRRGGVPGLEIAGNFAKVLASKTAGWCLAQPPQIKHENEQLSQKLNNWMAEHLPEIIQYAEDMVALGDFYMAVNSDLTLTPLTPDTVEPVVNEQDYKRIVGWEIRERINHPTVMEKWQVETNFYSDRERVRRLEFAGRETVEERFPNMIGRLNVIPMHNDRQTNDIYGTPSIAPLVKTSKSLLYAYNDVLTAAVSGNIRIGRPTPVIEFNDYEQMQNFMADNAEQISRERLNEITGDIDTLLEYYIDFDADRLLTLSGAKFKYAQPGTISQDTEKLLGLLFLIMIQILEIPEFVMGGELTSARATAETQLEIFDQWVTKRRGEFQGWLMELLKVVALFIGASTPGIGSIDIEQIELVWEPLTGKDGRLTMEAIKYFYSQGLIDKRTALMLAPVDIEDVEAVLSAAEAEAEEARQQREEQFAVVQRREERLALGSGKEEEEEEEEEVPTP